MTVTSIFIDMLNGLSGAREDVINGNGILKRPAYAIGGMVPPLAATQTRESFDTASGMV